ncbi:MAG: isochorismatase family cysteine hydrolase [Sarcina sp.]
MEKFLKFMENDISYVKESSLGELNATRENTILIVVDMVKGFYDQGALANDLVEGIINPIVELDKKMKGYRKVFFVDSHTEESMEFGAYPPHCIEGTLEEELIDELKVCEGIKEKDTRIVKKNSINGFHSPEFKVFLDDKSIENYIVVGVCSDICVKNLALTMKSYFNQNNLDKKIIVPSNMIETFDAPFHNREFWNLLSLFEMKSNGIKIIKAIV